MILIKYKTMRSLTALYLLIPFLLFIGTWIRGVISVPCILLLAFGLFRQHREILHSSKEIEIPFGGFLFIVIISAIWCWSAGIGGFFYQSPDHHFRNAVFHDLLSHSWPVTYENYGTGLVYYLGIWIVPAAFGKILLFLNFTYKTAWMIAEVILLLWCSIGITLLVLMMCLYFRQRTLSGIILLVLVLIGFSGLDIVGELWKNGLEIHDHIEWWSGYFQFRSNTTAMFWAYNQVIPCWLMTMFLLSEDNVRGYGIVIGCTLFYAPFSVVGSFLCILVMMIQVILNDEKQKTKPILRDICSCSNIVAVIAVLPILASYYSNNAGLGAKVRFCWEDYGGFTEEMAKIWLAFLVLELGIYICFFLRTEYNNPLMYAMIFSLVLNSAISIGEVGEVVYRISATMPVLFILMCFVIKAVFQYRAKSAVAYKLFYMFVILVFMIGSFTPVVEYCRAITAIKKEKTLCLVADSLKTLDTENAPHNFIGYDISEKFFYHYIAR